MTPLETPTWAGAEPVAGGSCCVRCEAELRPGTAAILCRECVEVLLRNGLNDEVMTQLYRAANAGDERATNADIDWTLSDQFPRWLAANLPTSARIVEFGGGGGFHVQAIAERGFSDVLGRIWIRARWRPVARAIRTCARR